MDRLQAQEEALDAERTRAQEVPDYREKSLDSQLAESRGDDLVLEPLEINVRCLPGNGQFSTPKPLAASG